MTSVSIINSGFSAIGRLIAIGVLAAAFLFGLAGVVFMSLQGAEIKVPEITGKDFSESEHELALLGLKIKKRADRVSSEKPNTVIEQLPKPGETVKTGQMILVVTSKGGGEGDERPPSLKNTDEDDTDKIEEMISEKPKKPKANANTNRKKADTARDIAGDNSDTNSASSGESAGSNSEKKESGTTGNPADKQNKNSSTPINNKSPNSPGKSTIGDPKVKPATRPRK